MEEMERGVEDWEGEGVCVCAYVERDFMRKQENEHVQVPGPSSLSPAPPVWAARVRGEVGGGGGEVGRVGWWGECRA